MTTRAASPIMLSIVVLAGAGCAARMDATPEVASSAAVPRSAPQPVANPSAASERPVPGEPRDDPKPAPIETATIATPPPVANDPPSSSAAAYVFTPDQVASALSSSTTSENATPEPATSVPHDAVPQDRVEGPPPVTSGQLRLAVVAPSKAIAAGAIVSVDVMASSKSEVVDAPLHLLFDPNVLEFVDGTPGDFLTRGGSSIVFLADGTSVPGDVAVAAGRVEREHGASGNGLLCRVRFRGIGAGTTAVIVSEAKVWGAGGEALTVLGGRTDVVVR